MKLYSEQELLQLNHRDLEKTFNNYLGNKHRNVCDKQSFLLEWVDPQKNETILECGSSSGKTCVDFANKSGCNMIGIDFDPDAIEVSARMQKKYFPELDARCIFRKDDLAQMFFDRKIKKIIMPDFTEHITNEVFSGILNNMKQLQDVKLYIYTPAGTHIFEILRHRNIILKKIMNHINVKTENEMVRFLEENGWKVVERKWRPSHLPVIRIFEILFGNFPLVGKYFHRKMAIMATPDHVSSKNGRDRGIL
ncbi:MAG: methyltransferase domain-containing protein [Minisyncoccia bacterium]